MTSKKDYLEFEENPYNTEKKGPEEIVRLFYTNDVPMLPVVSKRGTLFGILLKDKVISELSDLERVGKQKIDEFIMKIAKKMTLDELLPFAGNIKEFVVINLFGEVFGTWSRLDLFAACEKAKGKTDQGEVQKQKEDQVLEWMIYLVLEHIPRALYAVNQKGKTIFYNSLFEDVFTDRTGKEVNTGFVEKSFADPDQNEFYYKNKKDIYFLNKTMNIAYERIPLVSDGKDVGYLMFVDSGLNETSVSVFPGIDVNTMPLNEIIQSVERSVLVESIRQNKGNLNEIAKRLKISKNLLAKKIESHGIHINTASEEPSKT